MNHTQYGSEGIQCFEATSHLHLQSQRETKNKRTKTGSVYSLLLSGILDAYPLILNMKGIRSSETSSCMALEP
jgi:hypothetical protein